MAVSQLVCFFFAVNMARNAALDRDRRHRHAASNLTLVLVLGLLMVWPDPWYREGPLASTHQILAKKLKGAQIGEPWMINLAYRAVPAAVLAMLASIAGGALTQGFAGYLNNVKPRFRQPSGPFQDRR